MVWGDARVYSQATGVVRSISRNIHVNAESRALDMHLVSDHTAAVNIQLLSCHEFQTDISNTVYLRLGGGNISLLLHR